MAQVITPELETLLTTNLEELAKLFVGDNKPQGEIEIDWVTGAAEQTLVATDSAWKTLELAHGGTTPGSPTTTNNAEPAGWKDPGFDDSAWSAAYIPVDPPGAWQALAGTVFVSSQGRSLGHLQNEIWIARKEFTLADAVDAPARIVYRCDDWCEVYIDGTLVASSPVSGTGGDGLVHTVAVDIALLDAGTHCIAVKIYQSAILNTWADNPTMIEMRLYVADIETETIQVASLGIDRSRKMAAAQLDVTLDNETGTRGWYSGSGLVYIPNNRVRAYAWYGAHANRVQLFTGLLDRPHEHRNPKTLTLKARSRMKWMLEQGFSATAPQGADDTGAVRTEDNGVYIGKTIGYIVADIASRAGWPAEDVVIDPVADTITLAEYTLTDNSSWASQIAGADRLTTAAGCDLVEDELGKLRFEPSPLIAASEPDPDWTFAAGVNVLALDHEVDDEDRATRVEVTGPMTSAVPKWDQVWSTSALDHPVGAWYDPTDPDYLRVVDRITKRIYRIKQSDRSIASSKYLGGYPLGLSGDPTDSTHYFVLNAPWRNTGSTSGNSVKEYDSATHALLNTYSLPNGRWSALKTDGTYIYLTNYDDGKVYRRNMTGGAVSNHATVYNGVTQGQATGMWLNGTTLGVFFADHKRFLLMDTSALGTVTGVQSTEGTRIAGGESDTDTDIDLYAVASAGSFGLSSGMVAKFTLAELITTDVSALAIDYDLEDRLGVQSGIADRDHGACPNIEGDHAFEARLVQFAMKVVQSLSQAGDVGDAQLALLSRLRRVADLATIGHPGVQLNDVIRYVDAIAGTDAVWIVDSMRILIAKTYTQTMSVLPWEAAA